jgi:Flp pilus assembly protein TadG
MNPRLRNTLSLRRALPGDCRGAIIVEQLIVFLPVLFFVLVTGQVIEICTGAILLRHAAFCAARAAVVVLPDDPRRYGGEAFIKPGDTIPSNSNRAAAVAKAATMILRTDRHFDTNRLTVQLSIDKNTKELSATLTAPYQCYARFVNVACAGRGSIDLRAEGLDAYQGAEYVY